MGEINLSRYNERFCRVSYFNDSNGVPEQSFAFRDVYEVKRRDERSNKFGDSDLYYYGDYEVSFKTKTGEYDFYNEEAEKAEWEYQQWLNWLVEETGKIYQITKQKEV